MVLASPAHALKAADEYVWVYGEQARWWPPPRAETKATRTWPEVLPGIEFALLNAKDPVEAARRNLTDLQTRGGITNLLANGDFAAVKDGQPESWSHWQDEKESHGWYRYSEPGPVSRLKETGAPFLDLV